MQQEKKDLKADLSRIRASVGEAAAGAEAGERAEGRNPQKYGPGGAGTYHTGGAEGIPIVTVQYLHSYERKSNENRLWRWDFCVQLSGFWHIHAKAPRGIVAPG